jgi:hypothetical protein
VDRKKRDLAREFDLGGRAARALRSIGVECEDDLEKIDVDRLRKLHQIGEKTLLEIRRARTRLMISRYGTGYTDDLTIPLVDQEAHADLVTGLGLGARGSRALEILGIDSDEKLLEMEFEAAANIRGVNIGALKEIWSARDIYLLKILHGKKVPVECLGPDRNGRTPVGFSGDVLWVNPQEVTNHPVKGMSVPYSEILAAKEYRDRKAGEKAVELQDQAEPFDERRFQTRHRLNNRALRAVMEAGVRSDEDLCNLDLNAFSKHQTVGVKTVDLVRRAKMRMIMTPDTETERNSRIRYARHLSRQLGLSHDAMEFLAHAGVSDLDDLARLDVNAHIKIDNGRVSRSTRKAMQEVRKAQKAIIRSTAMTSPEGSAPEISRSDELAMRHNLGMRAARVLARVGAGTDNDLAEFDFDQAARIKGVGQKTVEEIRTARTRMMKLRHGDDYEDGKTRTPEDVPRVSIGDLELGKRALDLLDTLEIRTVKDLIDMDFLAARDVNGAGPRVITELREARARALHDLAGISRATATRIETSRSGKGLLVELHDGERLWVPVARCEDLGNDMVMVPRGLLQASRDWMASQHKSSSVEEDDVPTP